MLLVNVAQDSLLQNANIQSFNNSGTWMWDLIVLLVGLAFTIGFGLWYFRGEKSHQKLNAIPTIWTSLGILFTFIAIKRSLGGGLDDLLSQGNELKNVVDELVKRIIPAFSTSIVGIIGAIISTALIKVIYALEEEYESDEVEMIRHALDENNRLLRSIQVLQSSQKDSLFTFLDGHLFKIQELYDKVYETNKLQAHVLIDEYLQGIRTMLSESQASMTEQTQVLFKNHTRTISDCFAQELQVLHDLAEEGKKVISTIPDSIENAKNDAVEAVEQALVDKYNKLLDGNSAFVGQLIDKVKQLESTLSQNTMSNYGSTIDELKKQMEVLLSSINNALSSNANSLNQASNILSAEMNKVAASLTNSSNEYASLVAELNRMLPIIEIQTNQAEESTKAVTRTNEQLKELVRSVEEIIGKNQQLRFELMQWKRVHKQVKINDKTSMKECPNCHEENPIDANFCRKCTYPFWEIQTMGSKLNGDKQ